MKNLAVARYISHYVWILNVSLEPSTLEDREVVGTIVIKNHMT